MDNKISLYTASENGIQHSFHYKIILLNEFIFHIFLTESQGLFIQGGTGVQDPRQAQS